MNNDWLEDALKHNDRYINDAGFTARVVAALPARKKRARLRTLILGSATVAGLALAFTLMPAGDYLAESFVQLFRARSFSAIPVLPVALIGLFFWASFAVVANEN
jgi:hypothetical protein